MFELRLRRLRGVALCLLGGTLVFSTLVFSAGCDRGRASSSPPEKAASIDAECDDLPALSAEEEAMRVGNAPLEKRREPEGPVLTIPKHYSRLADVDLSEKVEERVGQLADAYFERTGKKLVITSGTRDPARQAKAMYKMLRLGADVLRLYRNKAAVREIKDAYDAGRLSHKRPEEIVESMYEVIRAQVDREVFISAHLRAGAVDVRNRTMSSTDKKAFRACVAELEGVSLLEETKPPHFHLQID